MTKPKTDEEIVEEILSRFSWDELEGTDLVHRDKVFVVIEQAITLAKEAEREEIYEKAKQLGSREIPSAADDWTDLMRWLENKK